MTVAILLTIGAAAQTIIAKGNPIPLSLVFVLSILWPEVTWVGIGGLAAYFAIAVSRTQGIPR